MAININKLVTEGRNPNTLDIDLLPTEEVLKRINNEDKTIACVVEVALPQIARLVDKATKALYLGGRLIYLGAGTSGRVGILDAVECPPTFSISSEVIQAVMAGGERAFIRAKEGAEDSIEEAIADLKNINLNSNDVVIGITASGRTPYAISGCQYAKTQGCVTASIATSLNSEISAVVDFPIEVNTGPEVIAGSTRMKAGTAQKMICNMISTTTMIKLGKVYQNLMVDVQPTNEKLKSRARNILVQAAGVSFEEASEYIDEYGTVKKALFSLLSGIKDKEKVESYLNKTKGNIHKSLEIVKNEKSN